MHFTSEHVLDGGILEREFTLGVLWTPSSAPSPLILLGPPGGLRTVYPRLADRARQGAANGLAAATIELRSGSLRRSSDAEAPFSG